MATDEKLKNEENLNEKLESVDRNILRKATFDNEEFHLYQNVSLQQLSKKLLTEPEKRVKEGIRKENSYKEIKPDDLYWAASEGDIKKVKKLLNEGLPIDWPVKDLTPLQIAIKKRHFEVVKLLINQGADIYHTTKVGDTALSLATSDYSIDIIKYLLNFYDKNRQDFAMYWAAFDGYTDIVLMLLEFGMSPEFGRNGQTPLHAAAQEGHLKIVKLLTEWKANIFVVTPEGLSPLSKAADNGHTEIVKYLLSFYKEEMDDLALYCSSGKGHEDVVKLLIKHNFSINRGLNGYPPLFAASAGGHLNIVELLIKHRAKVFLKAPDGNTVLSLASSNGHIHIVNYFLELFFKDIKNDLGLYWAACNGHIAIVSILLAHGSCPDYGKDGSTPLYVAAKNGHFDIVQLLIECKADVFIKTQEGFTALSVASERGDMDMVRYLIDFYNVTEDLGLHLAAGNGHFYIVVLLVECGISPEFGKNGLSPMYVAAQNGHLNIVELLVDWKVNIFHKSPDGATGLTVAALNGHKNIVRYLLRFYKKGQNDLALPLASLEGHYDIILMLLENKMYPDFEYKGLTPLYLASQEGHLEIIKLLVNFNADVFKKSCSGGSALSIAAQNGHRDVVDYLLQFYTDGRVDDLAVYCAAIEGHNNFVKMFLERGFPINSNFNGNTPLSIAAYKGHQETVKLLLRAIKRTSNVTYRNSIRDKSKDLVLKKTENEEVEAKDFAIKIIENDVKEKEDIKKSKRKSIFNVLSSLLHKNQNN